MAERKTRNSGSKAASKTSISKKLKPKPSAKPRVMPPRAQMKLPSYAALPVRVGAPKGSAWGVFGDHDEVGTINLLTPERVRAAGQLIRTGKLFALDLPINFPDPPVFHRGAPRHTIRTLPDADFALDDYLDNFYLQVSSQWDALCHIRHPEFGSYNGIPDHEISGRGGTRLGIDNLARRGIAGRGVLADVARYYRRTGRSLDFTKPSVIPLEDLQATLAQQKTKLRTGDILLLRIGWVEFYLGASPEIKAALAREIVTPGIEGTQRMAAWLWDNHVAAVAADAPAVEFFPNAPGEVLHFHLIAFFGMPMGELWNLEQLAEDCAADGRYEFFLTSAPLNVPGGVGSPPNALAIK